MQVWLHDLPVPFLCSSRAQRSNKALDPCHWPIHSHLAMVGTTKLLMVHCDQHRLRMSTTHRLIRLLNLIQPESATLSGHGGTANHRSCERVIDHSENRSCRGRVTHGSCELHFTQERRLRRAELSQQTIARQQYLPFPSCGSRS
jgi:hypothetical protein